MNWGLLVWVLVVFGIDLLLQRWVRQLLFVVSWRLTSKPGNELTLFGLLMFPGTLLHESSHYAAALLLGSHVSKVSLRPRYVEDDVVELGAVIAQDKGAIGNSVISVAPAIVGGGLILLTGWLVFDLPGVAVAIEAGAWDRVIQCLAGPFGTTWGWIGACVVVVAGINMLPSPVDLESAAGLLVLPVALLALWGVLSFAGGASLAAFTRITNSILSWLGLALTLVILLSVPVLLVLKVLTHEK